MVDFSNLKNSPRAVSILVSEKHKFVYFIISKNGCSSIFASILHNDFGIDVGDEKIWETEIAYTKNIKHSVSFENATKEDSKVNEYINKGYKCFTTIRDPYDRFISLVNHCKFLNRKTIHGINGNLFNYEEIIKKTSANYVDNVLKAYDKLFEVGDAHVMPQSAYISMYKKICPNIDIVNLKDLPSYYENLTNEKFVKNNVRKEKDKVITNINSLSSQQLDEIEKLLKKYEDDNIINILKPKKNDKINFFNSDEQGFITCIYGESGAGKSYLTKKLITDKTIVLDGDGVRYYINTDLNYSDEDRRLNNERIANIAYYLSLQGFNVIISTVRADIAYDILKKRTNKIKKYQIFK